MIKTKNITNLALATTRCAKFVDCLIICGVIDVFTSVFV